MTLKLGKQPRVFEYYQIYSNDDPGLTFTYFTARSILVPDAFVLAKGKTMDFSEAIVVYDLKLATDDRRQKVSVDIKTLYPGGMYAPCHRAIYTCIKSRKQLYKIRLYRDFFEACNKWVK